MWNEGTESAKTLQPYRLIFFVAFFYSSFVLPERQLIARSQSTFYIDSCHAVCADFFLSGGLSGCSGDSDRRMGVDSALAGFERAPDRRGVCLAWRAGFWEAAQWGIRGVGNRSAWALSF
jgi:hypothetical protein